MITFGHFKKMMGTFAPTKQVDFEFSGVIKKTKIAKKNISKIGLTLDLTTYSIKEAIKNKCDVLVCFHAPEILDKNLPVDHELLSLIKNTLTVYKAHLRLNFCKDGLNDSLCNICGFDAMPLKFLYEGKHIIAGGVYEIKNEHSLDDILKKLQNIKPPFINIYNHSPNKKYNKILISSGSGFKKDFFDQFKPDMIISGETKHGIIYYAQEYGTTLVEATHWATETLPLKKTGVKMSEIFGVPVHFISQPLRVKTFIHNICQTSPAVSAITPHSLIK